MSVFDAVDGSSTRHVSAIEVVADGVATSGEPNMQTVATIGLDIAKSVFQVHGIDAAGNVIIRRQLKRRYVLAFFQKLPPCVVGIEACATSHHWSRELKALGHTVRLTIAARLNRAAPCPARCASRRVGRRGSSADWRKKCR